MARPDTAGFYYYGPFYGHSKTQIVPGGDDTGPVDNPTTPLDPCDECPDGYTCVNGECVSPRGPTVNPNPLDNPTVDTQCRTYTGRGNGIRTTASGVFSGYDANSGGQWTFKCESKITFYGRLNHSASSGLVNDIRWGVGNHVRSFIVPEDSIDEQSIFRFMENVDGEYKIEIKRKASGDTYYDWELYQQGHLSEADGETLYVGVSAGAELWYVQTYGEEEKELLASFDYGRILHNITSQEIEYLYTGGGAYEKIVTADRDVGASGFRQLGDVFQWGNNYAFPNTGTITTTSVVPDVTQYGPSQFYNSEFVIGDGWKNQNCYNLWGGLSLGQIAKKGPCPDGYHIPTQQERLDLEAHLQKMSGRDRNRQFFYLNISTDTQGPRGGNTGEPIVNSSISYYWSSTFDQENNEAIGTQIGVWSASIGTARFGVTNGFWIRPFKNN